MECDDMVLVKPWLEKETVLFFGQWLDPTDPVLSNKE